jgi:hypothetical protein
MALPSPDPQDTSSHLVGEAIEQHTSPPLVTEADTAHETASQMTRPLRPSPLFVHAQFDYHTMRASLHELQAATVGRKVRS